jgi:hypothetical protein
MSKLLENIIPILKGIYIYIYIFFHSFAFSNVQNYIEFKYNNYHIDKKKNSC